MSNWEEKWASLMESSLDMNRDVAKQRVIDLMSDLNIAIVDLEIDEEIKRKLSQDVSNAYQAFLDFARLES